MATKRYPMYDDPPTRLEEERSTDMTNSDHGQLAGTTMSEEELNSAGRKIDQSNQPIPVSETTLDASSGQTSQGSGVQTQHSRFGNDTASEMVGLYVPTVSTVPTAQTSVAGGERFDPYQWLIDRANYTPETEEERERRERSERRTRRMAAVADILGAMHRAYSHARGVEPMKLPNMSERMRERYEKAAERRKRQDQDAIINYIRIMQQRRLDEQARQTSDYKSSLLEMKRETANMRMQQMQAQIDKLAAQGKTEEARQKYLEAQTLVNEYRAQGIQIDNEWKPQLKASTVAKNNAQAAQAEHNANRPYSTGGGTSRGGKGSGSLSNNPDYEKVTDRSDPLRPRTYYQRRGGTTSGGQKGSTAAGVAGGSQAGVTAPKSKRMSRTRL